MNEIKLDTYEQSLEDTAENFLPVKGEKLAAIEGLLDGIKKARSVNISIPESDLDRPNNP